MARPSARRRLSAAATSVWAKTDMFGGTDATLSLIQHLRDTAGCAGKIWDEFLTPHLRSWLATEIGNMDLARSMTVFLAGVHDVGKASPAFAIMAPGPAARMAAAGLTIDAHVGTDNEGRRAVRHELVSHLATRKWLRQRHGANGRTAGTYSMILGAHHGAPPTDVQVDWAMGRDDFVGAGLWEDVRNEILDVMAIETGLAPHLRRGPLQALSQPAQALISSVVILADWIASNTEYFPYVEDEAPGRRINRAWKALDLPEPWIPGTVPAEAHEHMECRFNLPAGARPRPVQDVARHAAQNMTSPGLMIVEAAMGEGKTEAALMAAEILAARFNLGGIYFGLPTQATSNAMFSRITSWMGNLASRSGADQSTFLAHSKRGLNDEYRTMLDTWETQTGLDAGHESESVRGVVHAWLADRRRGMLSSFAVGTIDQVLMAALKSKHVMLKHLALSQKVVVLDEVHAASAYMSVYLEAALTWLGAYRIPVILLSATLPTARREALLAAYEKGRSGKAGIAPQANPDAYPLITTTCGAGTATALEVPAGTRSSQVTFRAVVDSGDQLSQLISTKVGMNGRVAIIRNTVPRAQDTAEFLRAQFPGADIILAHARFMAADRAERDRELLRRFGPGTSQAGAGLQILVGTQVIEQSLDIDVDLMISDLAPIDLLLQRAGRLHRHAARNGHRPAACANAEFYITGVDFGHPVPIPDRSYTKVYEPYLLLRALDALGVTPGHNVSVNLPADIPHLVAAGYDEPGNINPAWAMTVTEARTAAEANRKEREREAATYRLSDPRPRADLTGWIAAGVEDPDSRDGHAGRAAVRDGLDSIDVILIQKTGRGHHIPDWHPEHPGMRLDPTREPGGATARIMATCAIPVTEPMLWRGGFKMDSFIEHLSKAQPRAWAEAKELRYAWVVELDRHGHSEIGSMALDYDTRDGLRFSRVPVPDPAAATATGC